MSDEIDLLFFGLTFVKFRFIHVKFDESPQ